MGLVGEWQWSGGHTIPGSWVSPVPPPSVMGQERGGHPGVLGCGVGGGGTPRGPQVPPTASICPLQPAPTPGSAREGLPVGSHVETAPQRPAEGKGLRWGGLCVPVPSPSEHAEQWGVIVCVSPPRDNPFSPPRRSRTRWCCRQRWPTCGRTTGGCRRNRTQLPGSSDVLPGYSPVQLRKKSCEPRGGPPPPGDPWGH